MALLQNGRRDAQYPLRQSGAGGTAPLVFGLRTETNLNRYVSYAGLSPKDSIPVGYEMPYTSMWPRVGGGLASQAVESGPRCSGAGTLSSSLSNGYLFAATITGLGVLLSSALSLLLYFDASLGGSGALATASVVGLDPIDATLQGSGTVDVTLNGLSLASVTANGLGGLTVDLTNATQLTSAFAGAGSLSSVNLTLLTLCVAALQGSGSVSTAGLLAVVQLFSSFLGSAVVSADASGASALSTGLSGSGGVTAQLVSTADLVGNLPGAGDLSAATLDLLGVLSTTLSGAGSFSTASLLVAAQLATAFVGSGSVTASLQGISYLVSTLLGSGSVNVSMRGPSFMTASLFVNEGSATTAQLAAAVWESLAIAFDSPGTMGEKLNAAGTAGDPWTGVLEGTLTAKDIMRILLSVASGRTEIVDTGGGNFVVKFKSLDGARDRIDAVMTGSDRTSVTLDTD